MRLVTGELVFQRGDRNAPPDALVEDPTTVAIDEGEAQAEAAVMSEQEDPGMGEMLAHAPEPEPEPEPEPATELKSQAVPTRAAKGGSVVSRLTAKTYDASIIEAVKARKKPQSKKIDGDFLSRLNRPTAGARAEAEGKTLSKGSSFGAAAAQRRKIAQHGKRTAQVAAQGPAKEAKDTAGAVAEMDTAGNEEAVAVANRVTIDPTRGGGLLHPLLREIDSSMGAAE